MSQEFDSDYTKHDKNGVPILTQAMIDYARRNGMHVVAIVYRQGKTGDPEGSVSAILPFLPNRGDCILDARGTSWKVDSVQFRASLADLADGSKAVFYQPTIIAYRPVPD